MFLKGHSLEDGVRCIQYINLLLLFTLYFCLCSFFCTLPYLTFPRKPFLYSKRFTVLAYIWLYCCCQAAKSLELYCLYYCYNLQISGKNHRYIDSKLYFLKQTVTTVTIFNVANVYTSRKCNILESCCLKQRQVSNWYVLKLFYQFALCFYFHKMAKFLKFKIWVIFIIMLQ